MMDVLKKLKINPDKPLYLLHVPGGCADIFGGLELIIKPRKKEAVQQVVLFALNSAILNDSFHAIIEQLTGDTLFWICYPKKSGSIQSDLIRNEAWEAVFNAGYHGVTEVAINTDWTGFRVKKRDKIATFTRGVPIAERKAEGIDFVRRTVTLPPDVFIRLNEHAGLTSFFDTLSFTDKKEYVTGITEAKKEETRLRRIDKLIAQLQEKMHTKKPGR